MPYLWNKPPPPSFFSMSKVGPIKQIPSVNPHPDIIDKFMQGGQLVETKAKPQQKEDDFIEKKPKKQKVVLPGQKLLKKLVKHKDTDHDEKKLKRILYTINSHINKESDYSFNSDNI